MSSPDLGEAERRAVAEVLATPFLSMGEQAKEFERAVCQTSGAAHAIAVSSGTTGLHLCVRAAGIGPGDLVLTTSYSFIASSNVLLYENAVPVFVDVDVRTGNIDPDRLAQAARQLTEGGKPAQTWLPRRAAAAKKPKAILAVDVFGQPADFDAINAIAKAHDLTVIEDSCEALGANYKGRPAGRLGEFGVYAFYPNKQMTTGEGGVVITDDEEAANFMRALRNQGRAEGDTWLQHTYLGYNYRLPEISAALGRAQINRLEEMLSKLALPLRKLSEDHDIIVEGHTDDQGNDARNLKLSKSRAAAVRDYLVNAGINADRLDSEGYGETKPIDDNKTKVGREANRRVEFMVLEQSGDGCPRPAAAPPP